MKPHASLGLLGFACVAVACAPGALSGYPTADDDAGGQVDAGDDASTGAYDATTGGRFSTDSSAPRDARAGAHVPACPDGGHTTITGTVYAPNGTLPLYDVLVYTPVGALPALGQGASCQPCSALDSVKASATALSDAKGNFVLVDPPTGKNVPLVVQVGKWRRSVTLPNVVACTANALTDPDLTRLPRNTTEGSIPKIAVTTGGADEIACMLPKLGLDDAEFGVSGSTAVTLYAGGGGGGPTGIQPAESLWNDATVMKKYDMLIFSCEGTESIGSPDAGGGPFSLGYGTKDATSFAAMTQYLDAGGRIFGTDFMYTVWKDSPDPNLSGAATIPGGAPSGGDVVTLDTTFTKGKALADWLANQYPTQPYGTIDLDVVFDNVTAANSATTQVWGRGTDANTGAMTDHPRIMTINMPAGKPVAQQCGKAVHIDAHVNQEDYVDSSYPMGCTSPFSAAEKAFAFFFFDLASCIQVDSLPPTVPPITPPAQ